jgi:NAD(P)-dependent dehydrogenase (short-subunit alcohol dehydrogenase family)
MLVQAADSNLFDLSGRVAVVTGGGRGIGRALAVGLARHGADVVVIDQPSAKANAEATADLIRQHSRRAWTFLQDLSLTHELEAMVERVHGMTGQIDILVNNAGVAYSERFDEIPPEHWRQVMAVNLDAVYFLTRAVAKRMIAGSIAGRIVNVSSTNGLCAEAGHCHYNASKAGVELLTQTFAIELGPYGITANTICPGIIETEILREVALNSDYIQYFKQHVPLQQRLGTPEECVGAVILLASRAGSYITGQRVVIDGGLMCQQVPRLPFLTPPANDEVKNDPHSI